MHIFLACIVHQCILQNVHQSTLSHHTIKDQKEEFNLSKQLIPGQYFMSQSPEVKNDWTKSQSRKFESI